MIIEIIGVEIVIKKKNEQELKKSHEERARAEKAAAALKPRLR